jgi:DNA-binding YbaB/EbfC family protein
MNIKKIMKQAQEMQEKLQRDMQELTVEGTSGGGMVKVTLSGSKALQSIKIDPEVVDSKDVEMLEDLIVAAFGEAVRKVEEAMQDKLGGITGGLGIPGL